MIRLNSDTATETILEESDHDEELKVTFYPPLVLQRRMWILDILRAENVTKVRNQHKEF
jgi:small RNA 2'-O-methyltransferase